MSLHIVVLRFLTKDPDLESSAAVKYAVSSISQRESVLKYEIDTWLASRYEAKRLDLEENLLDKWFPPPTYCNNCGNFIEPEVTPLIGFTLDQSQVLSGRGFDVRTSEVLFCSQHCRLTKFAKLWAGEK